MAKKKTTARGTTRSASSTRRRSSDSSNDAPKPPAAKRTPRRPRKKAPAKAPARSRSSRKGHEIPAPDYGLSEEQLADVMALLPKEYQDEDARQGVEKALLGRPSVYDPAFGPMIYVRMLNEGISLVEAAAAIGIHRSTLYDWKKAHPVFALWLDRGVEAAQAFHERRLRRVWNAGRDTNITAIIFYMKNRFAEWADTKRIEVKDVPESADEMVRRIQAENATKREADMERRRRALMEEGATDE